MKTAILNPTVMATAIVLASVFHSEPALADGGPAPSFAAPVVSYFRLRKAGLGTGLFPPSVVTAGSNGDGATALAVTNGYITALLRSDCTSAPSPPPPVGKIAVGPDYVIMTVAMGDPLDFQAAQQIVTDAIFESLMPSYCALARHSGTGCVTNRVQWAIETYDAGGNPKMSGCAASGCGFHYCGVTNGYITAVLRGENASWPPPPPVGVIAVGTDSVIMTLADGDPLNLSAARQLATDSVFESLMRTYCALPRGSGIGYSSGRVQWNVATYDATGNPKLSGCATSGCDFHACVVSKGYITALLRSECTSAPAPPPVGGIVVGPDYVIMTVADGDPFDYQAAQQLATDAVFASLMPLYCALPRHSGIGCVSDRVQWNLETYDAGGNPKVSGGPASGGGFHYFGSCSVTPQERIQDLIVWVDVDVAAGILSNGNSLTTKLGAALGSLSGAKTQAAINELKAFLNEVDTMVKTGRLPAAASQPLIDGAEAIITNLGGQPLIAR